MKLTVWSMSVLLAVAFLFIGGIKVGASAADLESTAEGVPVVLLKIGGTAEVLGALGLVLPAATRTLPILTPLAAAGLVVTMIGATITNIVIAEYALVAQTVLLGVLAGFVAWARFGRYAIEPHRAGEPATS